MIKSIKWFGKLIAFLIGIILLYVVIAYILSLITVQGKKESNNNVTIFIKTNGVHTDIVLPVKHENTDWSKYFPYSDTKSKKDQMAYVGIGWGDKGFYLNTPTWSELKFSTAFYAATGLSTTAIHTTYYHKVLTENHQCKKILISQDQYLLLKEYIISSLKLNENNLPIVINTNSQYYATDAFYEAKGNYSIFQTCNTWANSGLKHANLTACLWTPYDQAIFDKY